MKAMHAGAVICFLVAIAFYLLDAWVPAAYGIGFLGMILEIAAWVQVWSRRGDNPGG